MVHALPFRDTKGTLNPKHPVQAMARFTAQPPTNTPMKKTLPLVLASLALAANTSFAVYTFTGINPIITESFDGLGSTTVANVVSATVGTTSPVTGSGFDATRTGGSGAVALPLTADTGGTVNGGLYNYGAASAPDRALGLLASGSNVLTYGFQYVNDINSGTTVAALQLDLTQENWRSSTTSVNSLLASYAVGSGTISSSNYLIAPGFTSASGLNLVGPPAVTTNGALDGNLAANQVGISFTLSGFALAPGETLFVRWADANETGSDAGLAIDNLTLSVVPEPSSLLLGLLAGLGLMRRRR